MLGKWVTKSIVFVVVAIARIWQWAKSTTDQALSLVDPRRQRVVFHYHDGKRWRTIDPIEAVLRFDNDPEYRGDLHPRMVDENDPEGVRVIADAVRRVFGVSEYRESTTEGLTIAERLELFRVFWLFIASLKKNIEPTPTSPPPTAPTLKASEAPNDVKTRSDTSPSGSIDTEAANDKPIESNSESRRHSER